MNVERQRHLLRRLGDTALSAAADLQVDSDLANDLLTGRLNVIPPDWVARIESVLVGGEGGASISDFTAASWWAQHGWQVFPQGVNKAPIIASPHPVGSPERRNCKGRCGLDGHGHLDATTDLARIRGWAQRLGLNWGGIAARVPRNMVALDVDPRHGGDAFLIDVMRQYGDLPETQETISGRGDGGGHLFYRVPEGLKVRARRFSNSGVDVKPSGSAVRLAPSSHQLGFRRYRLVPHAVAPAPEWLMWFLQPEPAKPSLTPSRVHRSHSVADDYAASTAWTDLLAEHNWTCLDDDGDADGARWRHPDATSVWSGSVCYGLLFVYSTNTPFAPTSFGDPHGYTKFRAYAVLNHDADLRAAARALAAQKKGE